MIDEQLCESLPEISYKGCTVWHVNYTSTKKAVKKEGCKGQRVTGTKMKIRWRKASTAGAEDEK